MVSGIFNESAFLNNSDMYPLFSYSFVFGTSSIVKDTFFWAVIFTEKVIAAAMQINLYISVNIYDDLSFEKFNVQLYIRTCKYMKMF